MASGAYDRNVLRRRTLLALHDVELHVLTLSQGLEAGALDRGVMDEAVLLPVLTRDEAEPLLVVESLYCSGGTHSRTPSLRC